MAVTCFWFFILLAASSVDHSMAYDGYRVLRVVPESPAILNFLGEFQNQYANEIDFWQTSRELFHPTDFMISPDMTAHIESLLNHHEIQFTTEIEDVQSVIKNQTLRGRHHVSVRDTGQSEWFDYNVYHTFKEIKAWMRRIASQYKDFVQQMIVGKTFEGRKIKLLKIGRKTEGKPAIFIQGGIHAREWIGPATVIHIVKELVENYGTADDVTAMLDTFDWFILPILNIDGYVFSWKNKNRLWRKNRRPYNRNNEKSCVGVDLNRNYNFKWRDLKLSSQSPCSNSYHGKSPLSEPETRAITRFLLRIKETQNFRAFLDIHSYGQYWLYPWGYSKRAPYTTAGEHTYIERMANLATNALKNVHCTKYKVGPSARLLYETAGIASDWGYARLGATYSYSIELRDTGKHGFLLPERLIEPTAAETVAAVKEMGRRLVEQYSDAYLDNSDDLSSNLNNYSMGRCE